MTAARHALQLGDFVVTTDNSGGIGEKPDDLVAVSDRITARFAARVALLEQWAAGAEPEAILLHNFSGDESWSRYCEGIRDVFDEIGIPSPPVRGSSETNMALQQSALAVTMLGKQQAALLSSGNWYTYGTPLIGNDVLVRVSEIASLERLQYARDKQLVQKIWPIGSKGILTEWRIAAGDPERTANSSLDLEASAGPATVVLLQINDKDVKEARLIFGDQLRSLD